MMGAGLGVGLDLASLSRLMPMHLGISTGGRIVSIGPTLAKLIAGSLPLRVPFLKVFEVRRPAGITTMAELRARAGQRLHLNLRGLGDSFRGIAVPTAEGGVLLNLSFGIRLVDAVRQHALTDADFAATDMAVEMLYLVEVKTAVMAELKRLNARLLGAKATAELQALTDTLTGLYNRRALESVLPDLIAQGVDFGLMHIDLDYFKQVNDTLGHAAGDLVLREVARALTDETRASDTVARVGGDEFVVILPGLSDTGALAQIARRIIERLMQPIDFEGKPCRIGASIGMTISTLYAQPAPDEMLNDADTALYASKHAGRAQARFFEPPQAEALSA
jgi:diguanylate cyclase (GGDEF)-like protein